MGVRQLGGVGASSVEDGGWEVDAGEGTALGIAVRVVEGQRLSPCVCESECVVRGALHPHSPSLPHAPASVREVEPDNCGIGLGEVVQPEGGLVGLLPRLVVDEAELGPRRAAEIAHVRARRSRR